MRGGDGRACGLLVACRDVIGIFWGEAKLFLYLCKASRNCDSTGTGRSRGRGGVDGREERAKGPNWCGGLGIGGRGTNGSPRSLLWIGSLARFRTIRFSIALRATSESESGCVAVGERRSIGDARLVIPRDGASRGERGAGVGISGVGRSTIVTVRCGPVGLPDPGLDTTGDGSLSSSMLLWSIG
jgi:hypothetical protein